MGKGIVQQESLKVAGKRSRLWFHEDIVQVLSRNKGSENIEMIFLQFPFSEETREVKWNGDGFEKMENLKILIIKNGHFSRGPTHLPNSLRVLEWNGYPSQYLPFDFCPESLAIFNLSHGQFSSDALTDFSLKPGFTCVKVLRFDKCPNVTHIPDVSSLINLEELSFRRCDNLSTIHESVWSLDNLKILDAEYCHKLRSFLSLMLPSL
ncbi:hypothetical protein RJT34_26046 [Clitoria ternatea]|uniref:Uncharacterized protein n=1 Tax=Clitoria ternatea TaxID=43366 RepID=A0AAN9I7S8_CLITE